ncbi:MAG: MFS transporter [Rhodomicrobium sp.]
MDSLYTATSRKVAWRLIPYLMLCYFVAYLDRVNLGFAALTFKGDLGFSDAVYGLGAGIFFAGYFIFEVPSNIILEKIGARVWIARIMVTWGLVSAAMAFVQGETSFYVIRFLLGVAEAGFFPGIILYLTYWYTSAERAKMVGMFMTAIALSGIIGAPLSTWILTSFSGVSGLKSWQWLFILEAAPAILVGIVTYFYLTDRPQDAHWLTAEERESVSRHLAAEKASREAVRKFSLGEALTHPRVLGLALVYFGIVVGLYGLGFWLPQIVKAFGFSTFMTGWVVAIPYLFSAIVMVLWTRNSDRTGERVWHLATASFLGGAGLIAGAYLGDPLIAMVALTFGSIGIYAGLPTFWTLPTALLTGTAAAGGIALINAIGNLGGFAGPYLVGWIRDTFKDPALATASLGAFVILSGVITLVMGHDSRMESHAASQRVS